jgi:hypothetical protein
LTVPNLISIFPDFESIIKKPGIGLELKIQNLIPGNTVRANKHVNMKPQCEIKEKRYSLNFTDRPYQLILFLDIRELYAHFFAFCILLYAGTLVLAWPHSLGPFRKAKAQRVSLYQLKWPAQI